MVDQFERIERALQSTLAGQRSLSELEETFDDALKQTDDILEQLQLQAVRTREIAKKTRSGVDHARRALSMEKRAIDVHADNVPANSLHTIFCWTCLSKTQSCPVEGTDGRIKAY
ncbi:hypothetical protein BC832DRAFT_293311 [Gaertneriomyces semiglobifer]|nr:hypothetical protein BC832DRAFT_293311 [Gaertneriomyces semiglobifer]